MVKTNLCNVRTIVGQILQRLGDNYVAIWDEDGSGAKLVSVNTDYFGDIETVGLFCAAANVNCYAAYGVFPGEPVYGKVYIRIFE